MPRAVLATAYGGPEVLELREVAVAPPAAAEVLLEVRAAGVNPIDAKIVRGEFGTDPDALPARLGFEVAGVVRAVGPDAVGAAGSISVGDEVIAYQVRGGYAEQVVAAAGVVVPKPPSLSWDAAGGLLLTGATAVHALSAVAVDSGDTVLLCGAAGGVGLMAVQLARLRGARVIATASPGSFDLLTRFGAQPVAYGPGLIDRLRALAPDGVDAAIDLIGADEALDASVELVADRSRVATIAGQRRGALLGVKLLGAGPGADPGTAVRAAARLQLTELAGAGRLQVVVAQTYPLAQAADALATISAGHVHGKLILRP